jgi:hypothetical protein
MRSWMVAAGLAPLAMALAGSACGGSKGTSSSGTTTGNGGTGGASSTGSGGSTTSSSGGGADGGSSPQCDAWATAQCSQLMVCAPDVLTADFGSMATCEARYGLDCSLAFQAPMSGWTPAGMTACASALGALACPAYLLTYVDTHGAPTACHPTGGLGNGQVCTHSAQCSSGYCKTATSSSVAICGVCAEISAVGQPCDILADCASGLVCPGTKQCTEPLADGTACANGDEQCAYASACQNGMCGPMREAGQMCPGGQNVTKCNTLEFLYCNGLNVCARGTYDGTGMPCGVSGGTAVGCSGAGLCSSATSGTCLAPAGEGKPCGVGVGACTLPALCVSGVCTLPTASACP